jgi:hypothetical protein
MRFGIDVSDKLDERFQVSDILSNGRRAEVVFTY